MSNTTVTDECSYIGKVNDMATEDYKKIYLDSVEASFASKEVKDYLRTLI